MRKLNLPVGIWGALIGALGTILGAVIGAVIVNTGFGRISDALAGVEEIQVTVQGFNTLASPQKPSMPLMWTVPLVNSSLP